MYWPLRHIEFLSFWHRALFCNCKYKQTQYKFYKFILVLIFFISYACFEFQGSYSGRRFTDARKTYHNVAVYTVQN
jgi:hypothetical protein